VVGSVRRSFSGVWPIPFCVLAWKKHRPFEPEAVISMHKFSAVWTAGDHDRLLSLLDVLTAVKMDLAPLCKHACSTPPAVSPAVTIGEACALLNGAVGDLRAVIQRLDEMVESGDGDSELPAKAGETVFHL
jgi:hypothetical protein